MFINLRPVSARLTAQYKLRYGLFDLQRGIQDPPPKKKLIASMLLIFNVASEKIGFFNRLMPGGNKKVTHTVFSLISYPVRYGAY